MSWQAFDMFQFDATLFAQRIQKLVVQIYLDAHKSVAAFYAEAFEKVGEQESAARNQDEYLDRWNDREMLEYEKNEQLQALATMALAMLGALIEAFLRDTAKRMDHTCPPPAGKIYDGSKLEKRIAEYKERFGVDMTEIPGFSGVRETILARNSCLHEAGKPSRDYKEQTECRLIGWDDMITLTPEQIEELSAEVGEFSDVLYQHLGNLRRNHSGSG